MQLLMKTSLVLKVFAFGVLAFMLNGAASAAEGCWSVYTGNCPGCGRASGFRAQTISPGNCYWCPGWCSIYLTAQIPDTSDSNVTIKDGVVYVGVQSPTTEGQTLEASDGLLSSLGQVNPMAATVLLLLKQHPGLASFHIVGGKMAHNGKLTALTFALHLQGSTDEQAILSSATAPGRPGHLAETAWSSSRPSKDRLIVVFRAHELDESGSVVKVYYPAVAVEVQATGPKTAAVASWSVVP